MIYANIDGAIVGIYQSPILCSALIDVIDIAVRWIRTLNGITVRSTREEGTREKRHTEKKSNMLKNEEAE